MRQRLVIARMPIKGRDRTVTVLYEDEKAVEIYVKDSEGETFVNNIYLGHVTRIGTGGYFVNYDREHEGFLPKRKAKGAIFKNNKNTDEIKSGDELLVMADSEGVKAKLTGLTAELSISGKNLVACTGFKGIRFSSRLSKTERERVGEAVPKTDENAGFIVRTSSALSDNEEITKEARALSARLADIVRYGVARPYGTCLYRAGGIWIDKIKQCSGLESIVTDIKDVYDDILSRKADETLKGMSAKLSFYEDKLVSLYRLNNMSALIDEAVNERIWLRSGAYIVVQQTEAFVCIDVNSGKALSKRSDKDEYMRINMEAAAEAARQIRLRQLSGTILIDFINMGSKEAEQELIEVFSELLKLDSANTKVVDITPLGIMEVTRSKKVRSLLEQIG